MHRVPPLLKFIRREQATGTALVTRCAWHLSLSLILLLTGCAHWSHESATEKPAVLSPPKPSPDSVVLEAVLIRFPEDRAKELADIWRVVDESVIDVSTRRELHANGIQCGILVSEMPQLIRDRLKELNTVSPANSLERMGLAAEVSSDTQRLHCHAGRRKDLTVRSGLPDALTVVHTRQGVLHGATYQQPNMLMDLRATPLGDGRAHLKLTPEIEHGEARQVIVRNRLGMLSEARRDPQRWDYLSVEATIAPGQALLCTLTEQPCGLGQAFFSTRTAERTSERVLLVIRLMSSQLDDLFAPDDVEAARLAAQR